MEREIKKEKVILPQDEGYGSTTKEQNVIDSRNLRLHYLTLKDSISGGNETTYEDFNEISTMISKVDTLHRQVKNPREQIVDAEALLDITRTLYSYLKSSEDPGGLSRFISRLLQQYEENNKSECDSECKHISWNSLGSDVSYIFKKTQGIPTMFRPEDAKYTPRKPVSRRKRSRPVGIFSPHEVEEDAPSERKETDECIVTMFKVLKLQKRIRMEKLVLNRLSFAQTVENIFALSFLVKDGRAEIKVDGNGTHLVVPRNAPTAKALTSGLASYHHFVFRFDYVDWELMLDTVERGEEAMPHRMTVGDTLSTIKKPQGEPCLTDTRR